MNRRDSILLILIIFLTALAIYVDLDVQHASWFENLQFWRPKEARTINVHYGLDLRGGLKVLLAADVPEGEELDAGAMTSARQIVENRVNGLGLTEPVVQSQGARRIIVELPGIEDPELAVETIRGTALLEFIDTGSEYLPEGAIVTTSEGGPTDEVSPTLTLTPTVAVSPTLTLTPTAPGETAPVTPTEEISPTASVTVYQTVMTGAALKSVNMGLSQQNDYLITFELQPEAAQAFAQHTANHIGQFLCIVLDKQVLSCPTIQSEIPDGKGEIKLGDATREQAENLMVQLRYGALPVPLRVETINTVGPTLGEISVDKSIRAGAIGLAVVLLFMLVYYRFPGAVAALALVIYALLNFALYKLAPVTLTLPGIAGFLLSTGMAVDANILVFERMKEELRAGRKLQAAVEAGFNRAWTSIRDSQISILISCAVLYLFGTNYGASIVKGFALTLAIGTIINVFTAVVATRTFLRLLFHLTGDWLTSRRFLLGI